MAEREQVIFQSTLPVRGATKINMALAYKGIFQSTLPVRGATRIQRDKMQLTTISIHAPREGSDCGKPAGGR